MTDSKLFEELKYCFERENCSTTKIRDILIEYKNSGGSKESTQKVLENLRTVFIKNETIEDKILETLDIVQGWCTPAMKIWDY